MSKHTPGSWRVVRDLHGTTEGWPIALIGDGLKVISGPMHSDSIGAAEDDANLIAAAPEMLEALKRIAICASGQTPTPEMKIAQHLLKKLGLE